MFDYSKDGEVSMKNDAFTEKISLWLDNQLTPGEVTALEAHLADCPTCQENYRAMQQVDQLFLNAATQMAAPNPGFSQRFEARLVRHQASRPWQIWLTVVALLLGTASVFGIWLLAEGLVWVNTSSYLINAQILYQGISGFIESMAGLQFIFNLGTLLFKTSFIIINQPLFWGILFMTFSLMGLWLWLMRTLSRRSASLLAL